jgi:Tfp pilus assembly protein PilP
MKKVVLLVLVVALAGAVGYYHSQTQGRPPKETIAEGIKVAMEKQKLSPEDQQVLKIQLAIVDYIGRNMHPPDKLSDLVPEYFDSIPKDPTTGKEYQYERKGPQYDLVLPGAKQAIQAASNEQIGGAAPGQGEFVNPNLMQPDTFIYDPAGKRDPYKPFDFSAKASDNAFLTPLERYSLGQLRLTAVIMDAKGGATAFVEDAAGKGYPVRAGAKIGDRGGVILEILPDSIKVLESSTDMTGTTTQQVSELKIQAQSGSDDPVERSKRRPNKNARR